MQLCNDETLELHRNLVETESVSGNEERIASSLFGWLKERSWNSTGED